MILTTKPDVPVIILEVPNTITNTLQAQRGPTSTSAPVCHGSSCQRTECIPQAEITAGCAQKRADQEYQITEHWNSTPNDVRDQSDICSGAKPGRPMSHGVGGETFRSAASHAAGRCRRGLVLEHRIQPARSGFPGRSGFSLSGARSRSIRPISLTSGVV